ncbi:hypothetical protein M885DRAFT_516439 [Pelagophyceae sp. CCMP2097]|nr:hypothetical protein M885DRAFT_516439 [Pelagophyceae sp. CCMP2097]
MFAVARSARVAARRQSSTLAGVFLGVQEPAVKQEVDSLRKSCAFVDQLSAKFPSAPPPIDFAAYKKVLGDQAAVKKIEDKYLALDFKDTFVGLGDKFTAEEKATMEFTAEEKAAEKATFDAMSAEADEMIAVSRARIVELNAKIAMMTEKRTNWTTTDKDVFEVYPDIEKEIDEEIHNHEWGKDIGH